MKITSKRIRDFVFEQKCIPWMIYEKYYKIRNSIFNINTQKYWDNTWRKEKIIPNNTRLYPDAFGKIASLIPNAAKVADIGCGIGLLLKRLKIEKKCDCVGIDISREAIITVKEEGMSGIIARVPPVPLPSNAFDVVIATEILEHISNPKYLILEMSRIAKSPGIILITVPDNALHPHTEREHIRTFNTDKLNKLLKNIFKNNSIEIFTVKEKKEKFYRLIATIRK